MSIRVVVKKIGRPRKKPANAPALIQAALDKEAEAVKKDLASPTKTWARKPLFVVRRKRKYTFEVTTGDFIYGLLDQGTVPHIIAAKNAPTLAFNTRPKFSPKTTPHSLRAKKGKKPVSSPVFPLAVYHPGTEAREWVVLANERSRIRLKKAMDKIASKLAKGKAS
jgi:hypothetical protein